MSALSNPEAEAELLGSLMCENALIDRVADVVKVEDFAEPVMGRLYSAIIREASLGKPANPITLKGYFENDETIKELGGVGFLARLTSSAMVMGAPEVAGLIVSLAKRRRMQAGLQQAALDCNDLTMPPAEIVALADSALAGEAQDTIHQPTGGECFDELIAGYAEKANGVTCGSIPSLDALLGPMRPKQLVIGAGRPGMGKTALALSYGLGAAKAGHGVLFVSLEMSSVELAARMASDVCFDERRIPFSAIRDGDLSHGQSQTVRDAAKFMHTLPFHVIDASSLTTGRLNMLIRRHARRMAAKGHKLELVIVDYLQLVLPDNRARSNYEAVSEVSRALKAAAKEHGVAVFALAQLSREVEKRPDKRPILADLRDSGQIEQDADAVLFLLRPEYYLRQAEPEKFTPERVAWERLLQDQQNKVEMILAKRRNGVTGNAVGMFHGAFQAVR